MRRVSQLLAGAAALACATALSCGTRPREAVAVARAETSPRGPPAPSPTGGGATITHGLTIPASHPRLWYDAARLERARAWFKRNPFAPRDDDHVGQATRGLLGGDAAACRAAIDWALATTRDMRTSGVACDGCRWSGEAIILTYDWCHAHLTPQERQTFVADTNRWIDHWRTQPWGGPAMPENNYYWGNVRNELEWAIACYEVNVPLAERLLDDVFTTRLAAGFYPAAGAGGVMHGGIGREGSQYGIYINDYSTVPWATARLLGRDLYTETDYWRAAAYHQIYSVSPAPTSGAGTGQATSMGYTFFPYSDDEQWLAARRLDGDAGRYVGDFMTGIAMRWSNEPVGKHARRFLELTGVKRSRHVQSVDGGGPSAPFIGLPLDYYGAGAKHLYVRSAWEPSATSLLLQLGEGPGGGHAHVDWGTWQIWRNGRYLSRETVSYGEGVAGYAGRGTTAASLGIGHNAVLFNGLGLRDEPWITGAALVRRLESKPGHSFAVVDLTGTARGPHGNPSVVHAEREFVFVRALETLVVFDRLQSASANDTKTFLAHCETRPSVTPAGATCVNGTQALVMTTLVPPSPTYRVVAEGGNVGQFRIEVDSQGGGSLSYLLTVLQAKDGRALGLSPRVVEGAESFVLTLDASTSITFMKGVTSSGGSITAQGRTSPFRPDVQRMTLTANGPAWD